MNRELNVPYEEIINHIEEIQSGDMIYLGSDILKLGRYARLQGQIFDVNIFIDSIINKIGEHGTLAIPTFNWEFCSGKAFDYKNTVSMTGAIGNAALKRKDFLRTKHPIYSFAVWGKGKDHLTSLENKSAFGKDSPFGYFFQMGAKTLGVGVNLNDYFTYWHYVEELHAPLPYRYIKDFTSMYIDENGNKSEKTYSMFVRDLEENVVMCGEKIASIIEKQGILKRVTINTVDFIVGDIIKMHPIIESDIVNNRSRNLCAYKSQTEY